MTISAPPVAESEIYAVGDIHGRLDLLDELLAKIRVDTVRRRGPIQVVFLGDYIDRGLQSREVIERLLDLQADPRFAPTFLKGNHEEAMLAFMDHPDAGRAWLSYGGAETLISYGVHAPPMGGGPEAMEEAAAALRELLPAAHLAFLENLELWLQRGRYLFVHAGLRPGKTLDEQSAADLMTIRKPFLTSRKAWPFTIVHGHTPMQDVHIDVRRIGIDTGAYMTGRLSAVRLEGGGVRILATGAPPEAAPQRR